MATNFPASLDAFTNPVSSDTLDNPPHDQQHADVNDAMEALQAKVGVDGSAVVTSLDYKLNAIGTWTSYTPTLTNFTATVDEASYCQINDVVFLRFISSSVPTVTGTMEVSAPVAAAGPSTPGATFGDAFAYDVTLSDTYRGLPYFATPTTIRIWVSPATSAQTWNATTPHTWAAGDDFRFHMVYRAA